MNNPLHDIAHPLWGFLRFVGIMATLWFVLWLNASSFDSTEIKTIIWIFLTAAGLEVAPAAVKKVLGKVQHKQ